MLRGINVGHEILEPPEIIYTKDGKRRATHEEFSYHITPYQNPPVRLEVVKGFIDKNGQFLAIPMTAKVLDITPGEFRELISPTPQGKPVGDFRLSDVLGLIRKRPTKGSATPAPAPVRPSRSSGNSSLPGPARPWKPVPPRSRKQQLPSRPRPRPGPGGDPLAPRTASIPCHPSFANLDP